MGNDERVGIDEPRITGNLVEAGDRLAIAGREARPFHCGELLELEVAPGIWLRGNIELDHSTKIKRGNQELDGYHLNLGDNATKLWLTPGMIVRIYLAPEWPQPATPYEGQAWRSGYGGWKRYRNGQWVKDEE